MLPGGFPNLLANGAQGIAVGMATSIPPHNAAELCDAALHLIDKPDAKSKTLLKWVKGPDFPTGGIIVESKDSIAEAYMTGRGSFRTRAQVGRRKRAPRHLGGRHHRNPLAGAEVAADREDRRTAEREEAAAGRRCPRRIRRGYPRSSSSRSPARSMPALLMESLFQLTELESRIPLNLNVLVKGRIPKVLGLAECLREWLDHLRDVLLRRSNYRKAQIEHRLEVLGGYLIVVPEHRQGDQDHPHRG